MSDIAAAPTIARCVKRCPRCIAVGWVVVALIAAPFMATLGSTATDDFAAAPHTRSYEESNIIQAQFPSVFNDIETIFVQCTGSSCGVQDFRKLFDSLTDGIQDSLTDGSLVSMTNYFNFTGDLSMIGLGYYNASAKSMLATLEYNTQEKDSDLDLAVTNLLQLASDNSGGGFDVYVTGQTANRLQSSDEGGKIIGMAEGTGMIFIVLIFAWQVGSWRLTMIPMINTGLSLLIGEGLIYPLSKSGIITLPSFVPNVCLFLSIALSVDYSFFHLSRFQEVRREGADIDEAVNEMVKTAGRVVLVSGVVLLFTWLALAAFPVFGVNTLGFCSAITIFTCISVNLTMNPALICSCPGFFSKAAQDPWRCCRGCCCKRRQEQEEPALPLTEARQIDTALNCYGKAASVIVKMPSMIIVPLVVYALLLPAAVRLFTTQLVVGGINGGTATTDRATQQILQDFPSSGGGAPLTVLLSPPAGESVKSSHYFQEGCELARLVQQETGIDASEFRGVMLGPGADITCLDWSTVQDQGLLKPNTLYAYGWNMAVNPSNTSALITVNLPFDGFSNKAKDLVKQGRKAIDQFSASSYGTAACFHPMAIEVDAEEVVAARFPWVVAVTLVVVFSVIAIRYGAALIPVKLFFTIALPIISVLGTGVWVFQDGILNWTGIPSLKSQGGLVWINPVACTFMLIGFALDYDIFLFSRIYADRKSGKFVDDRAAIIHAVGKTGPVITTAGVIMSLSFIGMVAQSTNPFLCQMGFTMIFGVLVDTFVVRTLLVPAFLSMAGSYNWWPGKMPTAAGDEPNEAKA